MGIKITGTNTAAAPGITGDDTDTGLVYGTNQVEISTGGSSRVTVDSNGDLGIGTAPNNFGSYQTLHIKGPSSEGAAIRLQDNGDTADSDDFAIYKNSAAGYLRINGSDPLIAYMNGAERLRIQGDGDIYLGSTSTGTQRIFFNVSGDVSTFQTSGTGNSNQGMIVFRDGGEDYCGQITSNPSSHTTSYVTNSNYRLKENETAITDGITRVKQFKPYRFDWKKSGKTVDGFFAHEVQSIIPEAIIGTKDAVVTQEDKDNGLHDFDDVGDPIYQGIDQSKLVPLLTAALQEAITKIETLETKVAALEAA